MKRSDSGSLGVMFVQNKDYGLLVLKSGTRIAQEMFGIRLAQAIDADILVADARIIGYGDHREWGAFKRSVEKVSSASDLAMFDKAFSRPFWLM